MPSPHPPHTSPPPLERRFDFVLDVDERLDPEGPFEAMDGVLVNEEVDAALLEVGARGNPRLDVLGAFARSSRMTGTEAGEV